MSSLEIAELTGKLHKHVLESIRAMELAWEKVNGTKFRLVEYKDAKGEMRPCYELTKTECLYIATKFNDEARAKLVLRWEQLETEKQNQTEKQLPRTYLEALKQLVAVEEERQLLAIENSNMKPKAAYFDNLVDRNLLTNLRDTAKEIHLSQNQFIALLLEHKFVYRDTKRKLKPYSEHTPSLFELKDFERCGHAGTQLLVTPKGKETFRLMWGK